MLNLTILYKQSLLAGFYAFMIGIVLAWKDKSYFNVSVCMLFSNFNNGIYNMKIMPQK